MPQSSMPRVVMDYYRPLSELLADDHEAALAAARRYAADARRYGMKVGLVVIVVFLVVLTALLFTASMQR